MKSILVLLIFSCVLISSSLGGHIVSYGLKSEWQNANFVQNITLTFSLENPISANDYLKISAPLNLGTLSAFIQMGNSNVPLKSSSDQSPNYYFTGVSLQALVVYSLVIFPSVVPSVGKNIGLFRLYTQSSTSSLAIGYDYNEAFAMWAVAPPPPNTLDVSTPIVASDSIATRFDPSAVYSLYFDMTSRVDAFGFPSENIQGGSKFLGILSNPDFRITDCVLESFTCAFNQTGCSSIVIPANYTCRTSNTGFTLDVASNIWIGQVMRVRLTISNPPYYGSTNLDILQTSRFTKLIYEMQQGISLASTSVIDIQITAVRTLWRMDYSKQYGCPIGIYQPSGTTSSSSPVVNNVWLEFQVSKPVSGTEIGMMVWFGPGNRLLALLEGSIFFEGFPAMPNSRIICSSNYESSLSNLGIVCRGINSLTSNVTYGIGARIFGNVYNNSNTGADITDGQSFPKIQLFTINNNSSNNLTNVFSYSTGFTFYKNADMTPTLDLNIGSYADSEGRRVFSTNWALSYKRSSVAVSPFVTASSDQIYSVLCLQNGGSGVSLFPSSSTTNCTQSYKYGVFTERASGAAPDGLVVFINGAYFAAGTYNQTVFAPSDFQVDTHFAHKFLVHKDFYYFNTQSFGLNLLNNVFGDSVSVASNPHNCDTVGSQGMYCYPVYNAADNSFSNGVSVVQNGQNSIYLFNKFDTSPSDHALVTITCVVKTASAGLTDPVQNCAFYGSSRKNNNSAFPGFEFVISKENLQSVSRSSLYPDQNVRDMVYCMYKIPYSSIGANGDTILNVKANAVGGGISLKIQSLFNWFHIDTPSTDSDIKSEISFLNNACILNSNLPTSFTFNDGNHIPLLLRIKYSLTNIDGNYSAAALFFATTNARQQTPHNRTNNGIFANPNKVYSSSLQPHLLNQNFYSMPSSNIAGSGEKPLVSGFAVAGNSGTNPVNKFTWNYQPYIVFTASNKLKTDFYVNINMPSSVTSELICDDFFHLENVVLAFLSSNPNSPSFFSIGLAMNIYSILKYTGGEYYSAKYALNLGDLQYSYIDSGINKAWNSFSLYDGNNCAPSNTLYPITGSFSVGISTSLVFSIKTTSFAINCKKVTRTNGGFPGSGLTISYLTSTSSSLLISNSSSPAGNPIDSSNCTVMITSSSNNLYTGTSLQVLICPFTSASNIDLSTVPNDLTLNLNKPVPWFWGTNVFGSPLPMLQQLLTASWTVSGRVAFAIGQKYTQGQPQSIGGDSCVASAYSPLFILTSSQKITWNMYNKNSDILLPSTFVFNNNLIPNSAQTIQISDQVTSQLNDFFIAHACQTGTAGLNCGISRNGDSLIYSLSFDNSTSLIIERNVGIAISLYGSFNRNSFLPGIKHTANASIFAGSSAINGGASEISILKCGNIDTDIPSVAPRAQNAYVTNLVFSVSKSVMSTIQFSFQFSPGIGFWNTGSPDADVVLTLALGSLWNSVPLTSNVKCQVLTDTFLISSDFYSISNSGSNFTLFFKNQVPTLNMFSFRCVGALSPASSANNVTVLASTAMGVQMQGSAFVGAANQKDVQHSTLNNLNAKFYSSGFKSVWTFNVTFRNPIVAGKSSVYLYFPTSFSPKVSSSGSPSCFMDDTLVNCFFVSEYQLSISPRVSSLAEKPIIFQINGVEIPVQYGLYQNFNLQLDDNNNFFDGILEQTEIQAVPIFSTSAPVIQIPILFYDLTSKFVKDAAIHRALLKLPAMTVQNGKFLYICFPDDFVYSVYISSLETCRLTNEYSNSISNLAITCSKIGDHIIKMTLLQDANNNNSEQIYLLEIGSFINLGIPKSLMTKPIIFLANDQETGALAFSNVGYSNSSNLEFILNPSSLDLNIYQLGKVVTTGKAYKGYYGSQYVVSYPFDALSTGLSFTPTGVYSSNFYVWQEGSGTNQTVAIKAGKTSAMFWIGVDSNFNGIGLLQWNKLINDPNASNLPLFPVFVDNTPCTIVPQIASAFIPTSNASDTFSLPIIFDFSQCMPVSSIGVSINITQNPGNRFYVQNNTQLLVNDYITNRNVISFTIGLIVTSEAQLQAILAFQFFGTNSNSYVFSTNNASITSAAPNLNYILPSVTTFPSIGSVILNMNCHDFSNIFWSIGLDDQTILVSDIILQTQATGIRQTALDKESASARIFGWSIQQYVGSQVSVQINEIKSGGFYYLTAFCQNQFGQLSNALTTTWTQPKTLATFGVVSFLFASPPSVLDQIKLAQAMCNYVKATPLEINDQREIRCMSNTRRLQLSQSLNASDYSNFTLYYIFHSDLFSSDTSLVGKRLRLMEGQNVNSLNIASFSVLQIGNVSVNEYPVPDYPPTLLPTSQLSNISESSFSFSANVSDSGFLFGCVYSSSISIPLQSQLKIGADRLNQDCLVFINFLPVLKNEVTKISISNLNASSEYKFSVMISGFNIGSVNTLYSGISTFELATTANSFARLFFFSTLFAIILFFSL